jgi:hypothetical protein|nr:DUF1826 domain-containing protein [uncultured Vibrio sp.]|eukprot:Anaeramoba_ignava/a491_93.p2 GENE.a491_93~~a491_93.p2  ORF type:complete len:223 (-),score=-23.84 a491_93:293-961(-)
MSVNMMTAYEPVEMITSQPIATKPNVLADIYQTEQNITIWKRTLPTEVTLSIEDMLREEKTLALVQTVTPDDATEWVRSKLSGHACANALSEDIALIVDMFCCLFDLREAGLRLTALDKPMCPRFHVDHVPCRLVSTYVGSATQWLNNDDIDRSKLGSGNLGQPDHMSGLYDSDTAIQQMQVGDVALLKGSGWEGNEATGLVHRSPELVHNERRLLLTLDMV